MVPGAGLEPARLAAGDFESPESTNFTTRAGIREALNYGTFLTPFFGLLWAACQKMLARVWQERWQA